MKSMIRRASRIAHERNGNVIWLHYPVRDRKRTSSDPLASLKQNVAHLAHAIERSGELRTDIAAAIKARRYELYKISMCSGVRAAELNLAAAQRIHLNGLLRYLHAIAAVRSSDQPETKNQEAFVDSLARSIRELNTSMRRARELSRDVLAQSQRRDWRSGHLMPRHL